MKKFLALILALMCLAAPALAELPDLTQYTEAELRLFCDQINVELANRAIQRKSEEQVLLAGSFDDYHIEILDVEVVPNWQDEPCVLITYRFTNLSDETVPMIRAIEQTVFQGGIECGSATSIPGINLNQTVIEVRPGASLTLQHAAKLYDTTSLVEIELTKQYDYAGKAGSLLLTYLPEE